MVGLDKLMKEDALANRQKTQIDYLDSTVFSPEQTDIQKEYDITNSIELWYNTNRLITLANP